MPNTVAPPKPHEILALLLYPILYKFAASAIDEYQIGKMDIDGAVRYGDKVGYLMSVEDV